MKDLNHKASQQRGAGFVARVMAGVREDLARVGYEALSVPDLASRLGVNRTSIYRRWPTKRDLVAAALSETTGPEFQASDTGDLRRDLTDLCQAIGRQAETPFARAMLRTLMAEQTSIDADDLIAEISRRRPAPAGADFMAQAIARGEISRRVDPVLVLSVLSGAVIQRVIIERRELDPAWVDALVAMLIEGVGPR